MSSSSSSTEPVSKKAVTGTGRCGTRYTTALLSGAGINASHELVFSATSEGEWEGKDSELDVSMFAGFYFPLPYPVALQVRDPLKTISSWASSGIYSLRLGSFQPRIEEKIGKLDTISGALDFAQEGVSQYQQHISGVTQFWCRWNRYCEEHCDVWWRVEDIPNQTFTDWIGIDSSSDAEIVRSKRSNRTDISPDDIPQDLWPEFQDTAAHYGYHYER